MTVNFKFHSYKKKDGSQALLIRLRDKEREHFIPVPGVSVNTNLWDKKNQMLSAKHPEAELLNLAIGNYHDRIKKVKMLYELNQISFEEAIMMLEGSGKVDSLKDFINMMSKQNSGQWVRNSLTAVKSFGKYIKIPDPVFKDLSYNNLETLCVSMKKSGAQPESINNYLSHLRALFNLAKRKKIIYSDFQFPKDLIQKTRRHDKKIETHYPVEIAEAISKITLKNTHKRSIINTIRDFEAVGFWLLMFSMRGLYGKDITSLSSKDYNYDYNFKINFLKGDQGGVRNIKGNNHFLDHKRHKTKNKMKIMVSLPPIGGLISFLRRLVAQTHGSLAFLTLDELEKPYAEQIKKKDYDELKIFNHDPSVDIAKDDAIWNNMNKHLKKLGLYSLQSARKTFATTCSSIGIDSSIERNLLGQSDPSILRHYNNYEDKRLVYKIQQSHIMVLNTFKTVELYNLWLKQMKLVFGSNHDLYIKGTSEVLYSNFIKSLPDIVNIDRISISKPDQWEEKYKLK